jgi:hypothetical protein
VYTLQAKRSTFDREESGLCPLCGDAQETRERFLTQCAILSEVRRPYTESFQQLVHDRVGKSAANSHLSNENLVKRILGPSHIATDDKFLYNAELITRRLCYALHHNRLTYIEQLQSNDNETSPTTTRRVNETRLQLLTQHTTGCALKRRNITAHGTTRYGQRSSGILATTATNSSQSDLSDPSPLSCLTFDLKHCKWRL